MAVTSSQQMPCVLKGLLNKRPGDRLGWPGLLDHPFVRETAQERTKREAALADAVATAQESRAWKGEGGAIAGCLCKTHCPCSVVLNNMAAHCTYALHRLQCTQTRDSKSLCHRFCMPCKLLLTTQDRQLKHDNGSAGKQKSSDGPSAGVVLSAASKCDTPNVKGMPPSHRVAPRPSTGEPKRQPSGQRAAKADQPGRLQRAASAEARPGLVAAEAASPASRQASAPLVILEAATAPVTPSPCYQLSAAIS